ncbi:MAG: hypothetical protein KGI38_12610 [Thaumarchaeota archaeon]|nr:hypothetical protein [Nitrososphaerota archaeon]
MSKPKFRFSYRIYVREEGWPKVRNAIELRVALMDGEPATLEEVKNHLVGAASRAVENFLSDEPASQSKEASA